MRNFSSKLPIASFCERFDGIFQVGDVELNRHGAFGKWCGSDYHGFFIEQLSDEWDGTTTTPQPEGLIVAGFSHGNSFLLIFVQPVFNYPTSIIVAHESVENEKCRCGVFLTAQDEGDIFVVSKPVSHRISFSDVQENFQAVVKFRFFCSDFPFAKIVGIVYELGGLKQEVIATQTFFVINNLAALFGTGCLLGNGVCCENGHDDNQQKTHCINLPRIKRILQNHKSILQSIYIHMVVHWFVAFSYLLSFSVHIQAQWRLSVTENSFANFHWDVL